MTVGAPTLRKNIASRRGGGEGSPTPSAPVSSGIRIKLSRIPGVFDGFREGSGDEKTGKLVEITIIKAGVSLNGLDYLPATLKEAAGLFVGVPIYSYTFGKAPGDTPKERHLPDESKTDGGAVGNMVAQIKESWWDEKAQAIRGLVAVFDEAVRTRLKNAFEEKVIGSGVKQPAFGLSIDAAGLKEDGGVTKIVRPESVDMVKKAAAGGGFDRLVASAPEEDEDEMKPEEVIKLIEETVGKTVGAAVIQAMKEQQDGPGEGGPPDPLSGLRQMMEGMGPEERKGIATRVLAMFREMGLAEASPEQARAQAMHEAMKGLCESEKDADKLKEGLAKLVEDHATDPKDANLVKLEEAQGQLRRMAIKGALGSFKTEEGLTFHDTRDAMNLADLAAVQVAEDYSEVTGLTEALAALAKSKPYLLKAKEAADDDPNAKPGESAEDKTKRLKEEADAAAAAGNPKPAPRGQLIPLQEDDDTAGLGADVLQKEMDGIDEMLASGNATDRDLARRAKVGSALKRARALA